MAVDNNINNNNKLNRKQSLPSFATIIISVLSIVLCCVGFIRVELKLKEQDKRINALESVTEPTKPPSNDPDILIINAPGKLVLFRRIQARSCRLCFCYHY